MLSVNTQNLGMAHSQIQKNSPPSHVLFGALSKKEEKLLKHLKTVEDKFIRGCQERNIDPHYNPANLPANQQNPSTKAELEQRFASFKTAHEHVNPFSDYNLDQTTTEDLAFIIQNTPKGATF